MATLRIRQERRLRTLQPVRDHEDPYIVAVLVALAQEQRSLAREHHDGVSFAAPDQQGQLAVSCQSQITPNYFSKCPPDGDTDAQHDAFEYRVHVILTAGVTTTRVMYIYTARIPLALLDMFDYPRRSFPAPAVKVSYYMLPLSSPQVVIKALGRILSR